MIANDFYKGVKKVHIHDVLLAYDTMIKNKNSALGLHLFRNNENKKVWS